MSEYRETYDRVFKGANESFKGSTLNEENHGTYEAILESARELSKERGPFGNIDYGCTDATSESRNAIVYIEMKPPIMLSNKKKETIATMVQDADDYIVAVLPNGKVRMSFGIRDVWSE